MLVYDKSGKEYKVPHAVDRKEWIASGDYFAENPMKKEAPKKAEKK